MAELVKQNSKTTTSRPWPSDPLISASPTLKFPNANGFPKFESKPDITSNYQVTNGLSIVQSFEDISQQEEGCLTGGKSKTGVIGTDRHSRKNISTCSIQVD